MGQQVLNKRLGLLLCGSAPGSTLARVAEDADAALRMLCVGYVNFGTSELGGLAGSKGWAQQGPWRGEGGGAGVLQVAGRC